MWSASTVCANVQRCECVHTPNMCHVVWYRTTEDTFLEKPPLQWILCVAEGNSYVEGNISNECSYGKCYMTFISVVAKKKKWVQHGGTRKCLWVMMVMVVKMEEEKEEEEGNKGGGRGVMMMTVRITAGSHWGLSIARHQPKCWHTFDLI